MLQILQSYKSGELWLADVPVPACGNGGIVVRTRASFVSAGTERMLVDFAKKNIIGKALAMPDQVQKVIRKMKSEGIFSTLEKVQAKLDQPIPLGYSCAGVVEEVGRNVQGIVRGDRVACGGALYANHAEYNYVPKNLVVKIPDSVSFEDASCATVGSIALQGVRQCDARLGETVCVLGLGLLGIFAVQLLRAAGARVIGYDPNEERCKLAIALGADAAVSERVEAACEVMSRGRGVDAVLITAATHSNEPVALAGELCRMRGTVVATGMVGMDIPRDVYYKKELSFKLSCSYGPGRYDPAYEEGGHDYPFGYVRWTEQRNIEAVIDCIARGVVTPAKAITHRFAIEKALDAYDLMLGKISEPYLGIVISYAAKEAELTPRARVVGIGKGKSKGAGKVVAGFIGAGNFTRGVLFPNLRRIEGVRLKGLCTARGMSAAETGRKEGFEFATTDKAQILGDAEIDTVFIATRHDSHAKLVIEALEAGKKVFVEKPLAMNGEELSAVRAACEKTSGLLMAGFNRRFSPHAVCIRDYFEGRATPMVIMYRVNAGSVPKGTWIQDAETGGGRIIGEVCHFIDFASYCIGSSPVEVWASSIGADTASICSEDSCSITLRYRDGSLATIVYVALGSSELPKERCEVFADGSVAVMENFEKTVCMGTLGRKVVRGRQRKGFEEELRAFVGAAESGGGFPIPLESMFETTAVTFAAIESMRAGEKRGVRGSI